MENKKASENISLIQQIKQLSPQLKNKYDAIVFILHLYMKQNGFNFVGCGDKNDETVSNLAIPTDWNKNEDSYTFRYKHSNIKSTILLKAILLEKQLLVHAMLIEDKSMFHMDIDIDDFVKDNVYLDNYDELYKSLETLITTFKSQIVDKLFSVEKSSQKEETKKPVADRPSDYDPLRIPNSGPRRNPNSWLMEPGYPDSTPFGVGRSDIFPDIPSGPNGLWGPGSGNLVGPGHPGFNPRFGDQFGRGRGNLPRGHPPGARFDPFGPPGSGNRFGNPDNDEMPPPKGSGYDDMFM